MAEYFAQTAFSAGEIAPNIYGQVSLSKYHVAATTARNVFVNYRGGLYSRAGTLMCLRSKQPYGTPPRLIPFQFSINQGYALEFGNYYMRVYSFGDPVVDVTATITNITQANPGVFTAANTFASGDWVTISLVNGMTELNNYTGIVQNVTAGNFTLTDYLGNPLDTSGFLAYASAGIASRIFTLPTPWAATDLPLLKFTQSADVMSIVHPSYPPYDLARISATNWTLTESTFTEIIGPPATCTATATNNPSTSTSPPQLPAAYAYVVTAVDLLTGQESIASPIANVTNSVDIAAVAGSIIVNWSPVVGAATYNIYKAPTSYNTDPGNTTNALPVPAGALFGYVGTSFGTQFVDSNITADLTQVPPRHTNPFAPGQILAAVSTAGGSGYTAATLDVATSTGSGVVAEAVIISGAVVAWIINDNGMDFAATDTATVSGDGTSATVTLKIGPQTGTYPGVVAYFQQRRVYASTNNNPDTYYMSVPGAFLNFDVSIPVTGTDAITGTPWSQQVNGIQFMVPMPGGLVVLTGLGAWQVGGAGSAPLTPAPITPTSQSATPQAFNGCSANMPPIAVDYDLIYLQSKGSIFLDLAWNYWINIYTGSDLTQLSGHLFTGYTMREWAWCREPNKVAWVIRDDGIALSLTYLKQQEVYGWARHDTMGQFVSTCAVTEPPVDAAYFVVARATNITGGGQCYYVERMDNRIWQTTEDPWCVDCALAYPMPEPPATLICTTAGAFVTSAAVFSSANIGQVIRAAGGIATITGYTDTQHVTGTWCVPPTALVPNDPNGNVVAQAAGNWTMTLPTQIVKGLQHLAGLTVTGLADGVPIPPQVVSATGSITLPFAASNIKIGLGFTAQIQSPYLVTETAPTIQGRRKTITAVTARVASSAGLQFGSNQPDGGAQVPISVAPPWTNMEVVQDQGATYTSPGGATVTTLWTGDLRQPILPAWVKPGQIAIQQVNPLPLQVNLIAPEYLEGDAPEGGFGSGGASERTASPQEPQQPQGPGPWMLSAIR
jgi:hypothetical protein